MGHWGFRFAAIGILLGAGSTRAQTIEYSKAGPKRNRRDCFLQGARRRPAKHVALSRQIFLAREVALFSGAFAPRNTRFFALRKGKTVMIAFFSGIHYKAFSRGFETASGPARDAADQTIG
jgi:hypothetical protein